MTNSDVLLPCPFCGATPSANDTITFQTDSGGKWGHVVCCIDGPDVRTGYQALAYWRDEAIKAWNTRAPVSDTTTVR